MITVQDMERMLFSGGDVVGDDGTRIGRLGQLFLDARTGHPAWVTVTTGLFGRGESFVPMNGAELHGDALHVPYGKDLVKHAPRIESAEGHLSPDEERDLYRHYGLLHDDTDDADDTGSRADTEASGHRTGRHVAVGDEAVGGSSVGAAAVGGMAQHGTPTAAPVPTNAPAPLAPTSPGPPPLHTYEEVARAERDADDDRHRGDVAENSDVPDDSAGRAAGASAGGTTAASSAGLMPGSDLTDDMSTAQPAEGMMLSAEQARVVGTERVPTERVRMRRYTVTEHKQVTVPVEREEIRVEYEPAHDGALVEDDDADDHPEVRAADRSAPGDAGAARPDVDAAGAGDARPGPRSA